MKPNGLRALYFQGVETTALSTRGVKLTTTCTALPGSRRPAPRSDSRLLFSRRPYRRHARAPKNPRARAGVENEMTPSPMGLFQRETSLETLAGRMAAGWPELPKSTVYFFKMHSPPRHHTAIAKLFSLDVVATGCKPDPSLKATGLKKVLSI